HFQRSINLVRDFYEDRNLDSYVVTTKGRELLERIVESLHQASAQRAWSITGPYGGGKSAFALFASHLFRGSEHAFDRLQGSDELLASSVEEALPGVFCPILIVGSREPLGRSLLRGLSLGLSSFVAQYGRHPGRPSTEVQELRETLQRI